MSTTVYVIEGKKKSKEFYVNLQKNAWSVYKTSDQLILMGDLNAWVGGIPIPKLIGPSGEITCDRNRKLISDCSI